MSTGLDCVLEVKDADPEESVETEDGEVCSRQSGLAGRTVAWWVTLVLAIQGLAQSGTFRVRSALNLQRRFVLSKQNNPPDVFLMNHNLQGVSSMHHNPPSVS